MNAWIADPEEKKIIDIWVIGEPIPKKGILVFSLFEIFKSSFSKDYFRHWCDKVFFSFFKENEDFFFDTNFDRRLFKKEIRIWITLPTAIYVCGLLKTNQSRKMYDQLIDITLEKTAEVLSKIPLRMRA